MKFYGLPTSSFGRMLSEALIVVHSAKQSKVRLILVAQDKVASQYLSDLLSLEFSVWNSFFARKFYSLLVKLNFLIIDQRSQLENEFFFEKLFNAQRFFRQKTLLYNNDLSSEISNHQNRPKIIFAARTDTYWNLQNNRTEQGISIRNSDIEWIEKTINLLINNGFFVIRLGTKANPKLSIESPFFFDYSLSDLRTDKNDFRICALADFAVTTAGGISLLPSLLGIPGITVNSGLFTDIHPQEYLQHYLPKSVFRVTEGTALSASELADFELRDFQKDSDYGSIGLEIRSVSPEDSLTAILDFYSNFVAPNLAKHSNSEENDNFRSLPSEIREQFPKEIFLPESNSKIGIRIHKLWKNF